MKGDNEVIIIINFSDQPVSFNLNDESLSGDFKDVFTGEMVNLSEEMTFDLQAWGYSVMTKGGK